MPRLTVYITDELQERMAKVAPFLNASLAAREGIKRELVELEATLTPATIKAIGVARQKRR
jgi:hypothetical protein